MLLTGQIIADGYLPDVNTLLKGETSLQDDPRTKRKTCEFGYSFFRMMNKDRSFREPPAFLQTLGKHVVESMRLNTPDSFTNIIVSEYAAGFHLEPHVDMNEAQGKETGFWFGEEVFGVILEADATGHLYLANYEGEGAPPLPLKHCFDLEERAGLTFCLKEETRHAPFYHGVSDVQNRRISVTFRTVCFS